MNDDTVAELVANCPNLTYLKLKRCFKMTDLSIRELANMKSRQHLAFLLWPDSDEPQARTNLRNLLHHLRRALPEAERLLRIDTQDLQWLPDGPFTLDVADLEQAVAAGELEKAAALYTGDLLPSCWATGLFLFGPLW